MPETGDHSSPTVDPLERKATDELYAVARGAISAVPMVGGPLAELFGRIVTEPAQARRDAVLCCVLERIQSLETQGHLNVEQLANQPEFHACFLRGVQAALREIETDKIRTIEDAIINTALEANLEPAIKSILFSRLERATTEHIKLLRMVASVASKSGSTHVWPDHVISDGLKEYDRAEDCMKPMPMGFSDGSGNKWLDEREIELRRAILSDLVSEGLLRDGVDEFAETAFSPRTTSHFVEVTTLGELFLKFIEDPNRSQPAQGAASSGSSSHSAKPSSK